MLPLVCRGRLTETERLESLLREVDPSFRISPGASEVRQRACVRVVYV